jgi:hypothetical protein
MMSFKIRPFYLMRHSDVNGLSGTGVVAVGVVWPNGKAHMQWISFKSSFEMHDSVEALIDIHGHSGATELIYGDPPSPEEKPIKKPRKKKTDG